jgi:outer membrane protein TolC
MDGAGMSRRSPGRAALKRAGKWPVPGLWRLALAGMAFLPAAPLPAQQELSLPAAVQLAMEQQPNLRSSEAAERSAAQRVIQARAGRYPMLNYTESVNLGNNPVYVFGSLLEQHRFGPGNFDIGSLNRPDALSNFASQLTAQQVVYDGHATEHQTQLARSGEQISAEQTRQAEMDVVQSVLESYFQAVLAREQQSLAEQMLATTQAELQRAEAVRDAGMSTDADVMALRTELAAMQDRLLVARNGVQLALEALNNAMGVPLEAVYQLTTPLNPAALAADSLESMEDAALRARPELRQAQLAQQSADQQLALARSAFQPQVSVFGTFEANRRAMFSGGGTNWMTGAMLNWNLFRGMADRAREEEAIQTRSQREQQLRAAVSGVRLQVRQAFLNLQSANSRIQVAEAAIGAAEEAQRITSERYAAGMATVTDLLRSQTALQDARTRRLGAIYEQRAAAIRLERAVGTVSPSSAGVNP